MFLAFGQLIKYRWINKFRKLSKPILRYPYTGGSCFKVTVPYTGIQYGTSLAKNYFWVTGVAVYFTRYIYIFKLKRLGVV